MLLLAIGSMLLVLSDNDGDDTLFCFWAFATLYLLSPSFGGGINNSVDIVIRIRNSNMTKRVCGNDVLPILFYNSLN